MSAIVVTGLYIYPVKSCRGILLSETVMTHRGLPHDREWMVVDEQGGFLSQRALPRMALVETALTDVALRLSAPDMQALEVPLAPGYERTRRAVQVWRDVCPADDEGDAAAAWFSEYLGVPCRLVRFAPEVRRLSSPDWTQGFDAENRFSDGYPLLVISEESLEELNRRLDEPLPMDRFRPNLVVRGLGVHGEDTVGALSLADGQLTIQMVKPCVRCKITTTDQLTAEVGKEPLRTLATYRRDRELNGVTFGMNAIVTRGVGVKLEVSSSKFQVSRGREQLS